MKTSGNSVARIPFEASDFPAGARLNASGALKVTWNELLWATACVGKARRDLWRNGRFSLAEIIHRISLIDAYFSIQDGRVIRSPAFKNLDPSEKAIASYYIGMSMAKIYAEKKLDISWMMHISRYEKPWAVSYGSDPTRPDLFGCNRDGEWAVAEAKGRDRVTTALVQKMRLQKSSVATVNGALPAYRFGTATRFEAGQLALRVVDPPARPDAQEIPIDPLVWLEDYYAPILELIESGERHSEGDLEVTLVPGTNIEIGVSEEILAWSRENRERPRSQQGPRPRVVDDDLVASRWLTDQGRVVDRPLIETVLQASARSSGRGESFGDGVVVRSTR